MQHSSGVVDENTFLTEIDSEKEYLCLITLQTVVLSSDKK